MNPFALPTLNTSSDPPHPLPPPIRHSFPRSLHRFLVNKQGEVVERFSSVADPMTAPPPPLHRFLVNKRGEVVERFSSVADPMSAIEPKVAKLLAEGGDATCPPSAS